MAIERFKIFPPQLENPDAEWKKHWKRHGFLKGFLWEFFPFVNLFKINHFVRDSHPDGVIDITQPVRWWHRGINLFLDEAHRQGKIIKEARE